MRRKRQSRTVVVMNGTTAVALVALIAAVALVVHPPAPPGIAEFAPQATKPIVKAPPQQATRFGSGSGCAVGAVCAAATTRAHLAGPGRSTAPVPGSAPTTLGVPSALQCYTWPDGAVTQTFDPQSPPCVANWPGANHGNGGATSPGVTPTTIRIAINFPVTANPPWSTMLQAITGFFNQHFEFYGRQIQLVSARASGGSGPAGQRAEAIQAGQVHAFADIDWHDATYDYSNSVFLDTLAQEKIIGVNSYSMATTSQQLRSLSPYAWSYYPTVDNQEANLGQFICRALVGHPANHAGDPALRTATRSFAVLYPEPTNNPPIETATIRDALAGCGVNAPVKAYEGYPQATAADPPSSSQLELMLGLKQQGVSSVIVLGSSYDTANTLAAAEKVGYHPEWLMSFSGETGLYEYEGYVPADEKASLMGIAYWNKELPDSQDLGYEALTSENPDPNVDSSWQNQMENFYKSLLLIASGIQAAGPQLTPETFATGLRSLDFPNPDVDGPPWYQARVGGFNDGVAMVDDYALWYWSQAAQYYDSGTNSAYYHAGGACYVAQGARWSLGNWPQRDPGFFNPTAAC